MGTAIRERKSGLQYPGVIRRFENEERVNGKDVVVQYIVATPDGWPRIESEFPPGTWTTTIRNGQVIARRETV